MAQDSEKRSILVTSALPYANAPLHLGHILEHTQTDIWVRFQKLYGNECTYVCADDAHGTPIMLKADELSMSPEELIEIIYKEHKSTFEDFKISHETKIVSAHRTPERLFSYAKTAEKKGIKIINAINE